MKNSIDKMLRKIKLKASELYLEYQIPDFLYKDICKLSRNSDISYIQFMSDLTSCFIRIKFYYKNCKDYDTLHALYKKYLERGCIL